MWWPLNHKYPECRAEGVDSQAYDYIVVGGGTAGCILASRLSEDPTISVLVLERGFVNDTLMSRIPLVTSNIFDKNYGAVSTPSEPMTYCDGRQSMVVTVEALGGASRINGMLYTRGTVADYDAWRDLGHPDWGYEKVLKYFVKGEHILNQPESSYRGKSGPLIDQALLNRATWPFKVCRASVSSILVQAAKTLGFKLVSDLNSPEVPAEVIAPNDFIVDERRQRMSTFRAFLPMEIAIEREKNLKICTGVLVLKVVFSGIGSEGNCRAEAVSFQQANSKSGKVFSAKVNKEVIICAGAISSPHILMLSGIGSHEHLEEHGIEVVHDLPGGGCQLSDHMAIPICWEVPVAESITRVSISPLRGLSELLKYFIFHSGVLAAPFQVCSLYARSSSINDKTSDLLPSVPLEIYRTNSNLNPQDYIPDIELMPLATAVTDTKAEYDTMFSKMGGFCLLPTLLQPKSRGTIRLASADPRDRPKVDHGFLSDPSDYKVARKAIRLSLKLGDAMRKEGSPLLRTVITPEPDAEDKEVEMDKFIRSRARTAFHYASTCRMALEDDPKAPGAVDDELRVYGVENLRVCDASVLPWIISAHTMASVTMVAEKCADMIKST